MMQTHAHALPPSGERAGEASGARTAPRILIIDTIADSRTRLARRFARRGFETMEAGGGRHALDLLDKQAFDTVLLDARLPDLDGIEVLRRIRARFSSMDLPVIMVADRSEREDFLGALGSEADDYIARPVDFAVALARVHVQIDRRRAEETARRANEALRMANETLEDRISERTARLVEINHRLKGEIEQRQRSEAQSHYLAYHDALTGLANRLLFREELEAALARMEGPDKAVAVLFIDLDGFKSVNDTLGHSVGDLLLKAIAVDLRDTLTEADRIARLGGDEFALLQSAGAQPSGAMELASRIIELASLPRVIDGHHLTVGASVGIVVTSSGDDDPESLLKSADLAMYRAKADGRGAYRVFNPDMDAKAQARRMLELDMRNGFHEGQFRMFYQPLVSLSTHAVVGFEALMRWSHPQRGAVSPGEFIPVAEDTGLIVQLGDWALRQACTEAMTWPAQVRIAVNVSPVQFMRGNIVSSVVSALASAGLTPQRLEIEITESVLLEKTDRNLDILNQLRALGVRISMDDFGTGYSSLGYLRRFQFDKIKIDQSFIRDLAHDFESGAIVHAIAGLGSSFGIATTAEGVETREQLRRLNIEGCTEVQGRIYSMPVPADEVPALLESLKSRQP